MAELAGDESLKFKLAAAALQGNLESIKRPI